MYQDAEEFPIKCPRCKHEFLEQIGRLKAATQVQCPDCQLWIGYQYDTEEFGRALKHAKEIGHDVFRRFSRLKPKT